MLTKGRFRKAISKRGRARGREIPRLSLRFGAKNKFRNATRLTYTHKNCAKMMTNTSIVEL